MEAGVSVVFPIVEKRVAGEWQGLAFDAWHGFNIASTTFFAIEGAGNSFFYKYFVHRKIDIRDTWNNIYTYTYTCTYMNAVSHICTSSEWTKYNKRVCQYDTSDMLFTCYLTPYCVRWLTWMTPTAIYGREYMCYIYNGKCWVSWVDSTITSLVNPGSICRPFLIQSNTSRFLITKNPIFNWTSSISITACKSYMGYARVGDIHSTVFNPMVRINHK